MTHLNHPIGFIVLIWHNLVTNLVCWRGLASGLAENIQGEKLLDEGSILGVNEASRIASLLDISYKPTYLMLERNRSSLKHLGNGILRTWLIQYFFNFFFIFIFYFLFFLTLCYCSLAEKLESIRESLDERGISALSLFLECRKVKILCNLLISIISFDYLH